MNLPLVSVAIVTYNQRQYIEECLKSILLQKFSSSFEIVINDDCSTDGTSEICQEIVKNSNADIKYIRNSENLGMMMNWIDNIERCKGKYVALCEGDDYWTDQNKLQAQFDFLESREAIVGCFHNTEERYEDDPDRASYLYCNFQEARVISFSDMSFGNLMPTCSVMFRSKLFGSFPDWYTKLKMADWPLHLLNAQFGDFWYLPRVMGVHRLHKQSIWMLQDIDRNNLFIEKAYDVMIEGFSQSSKMAEQLNIGKLSFLDSIQRRKSKWSLKKKMKNFVIGLIKKV